MGTTLGPGQSESHPPVPESADVRTHQLVPPINAAKLGVLDIERIVNALHIRHEINFDVGWHFIPVLPSDQAEDYWRALKERLAIYARYGPSDSDTHLLRKAFEELAVIMAPVVSERDRRIVSEVLDSSLFVQQIQAGTFDYVAFSNSIARVIQRNCAPRRDDTTRKFLDCFRPGRAPDDVNGLVKGTRLLFELLESMRIVPDNYNPLPLPSERARLELNGSRMLQIT